VIDGNCKCSRIKCMAQSDISLEYDYFGCPNTPLKGTYFCVAHSKEKAIDVLSIVPGK